MTDAAVASRHGNVHAVPRLGRRAGRRPRCGWPRHGRSPRSAWWWCWCLLARYTTWGRQFWRVTGDYFKGRQSIPVWALLGVLLAVGDDRRAARACCSAISPTTSSPPCRRPSKAQGEAKDAAIHGFWVAILILAALIVADVGRTLLDIYLMQRFIIRWRVWLTDRLTERLARRRRVLPTAGSSRRPSTIPTSASSRTSTSSPPGPARKPTPPTVGTAQTLVFGAVFAIVSVVAFTPILWSLSGPLTIFGVDGARGRCSGSPCSMCSSRPWWRSGSVAR